MPITSSSSWVEQNLHATKRKRAGLVCVGCHGRKIKCDLQARSRAGQANCSRCMATNQECRLRPSKRGHHQNTASRRSSSPQAVVQSQSQVDRENELETALCTPPYSSETIQIIAPHGQQPDTDFMGHSNESFPAFPQRNNYLYPQLPRLSTEQLVPPQIGVTVNSHLTGQDQPTSSAHTKRMNNSELFLGESGFLNVYSQEAQDYTNGQDTSSCDEARSTEVPGPDLMGIFTETFFNCCYAFCPVLDRKTAASSIAHSSLLGCSIALVGSHVQPPVLPSVKPATYYGRAKQMFHSEQESDSMKSLQAVCLFYWWSPRPSRHTQRDAAWWWSAVGIRIAQQLGLHREPKRSHPITTSTDRGLQRRIWWTLFARERLTAICQGRPCLIDPSDCNIKEPSPEDFPDPTDPKNDVFIYWVRICSIIGRVAKYRSRAADVVALAFPTHLAEDLIGWVQSLPPHLCLPIAANATTAFDRDVHQLHLPYLATIIILHLSPSSQPLPRAYVAAVVAASSVARIFKDYLSRGGVRFLMPVSGWICGIATLALLRARRHTQLRSHAEEDIKILVIALTELRLSYPVADMFLQGYERLRACEKATVESGLTDDDDDFYTNSNNPSVEGNDGVDWARYFPFMTTETSGLAGVLMAEHISTPLADQAWFASMPVQLEDLFGPFGEFPEFI